MGYGAGWDQKEIVMRTSILTLTITVLLLMVGSARAAEGIAGSAHDFSKFSWSDGEICKPCHTPHNAIEATVTGRLWNHTLSTSTYTLHGTSSTGIGTRTDLTRAGGQADMDQGSRLCLSCHDGTVALDSFGGTNGSEFLANPDQHGSVNLGTNLSNDHPVGIAAAYNEMSGLTYNSGTGTFTGHARYQPLSVVSAAGLRLADTGGTPTTYVNQQGVSVTSNKLVVSCITCHDVHNGAGFSAGLLRGDNAGSKLCLSCHAK
jgi:predicted CXXCH cytochrome family protein